MCVCVCVCVCVWSVCGVCVCVCVVCVCVWSVCVCGVCAAVRRAGFLCVWALQFVIKYGAVEFLLININISRD